VDDTELHRYAFWFRNHDVYRNALSAGRRRRPMVLVWATDVRLGVIALACCRLNEADAVDACDAGNDYA
jgi:hypothetical protein